MTKLEMQPKISIIVPCYKVENYLPRCLDSLMTQTLGDIEVVCVNDGSPDQCIDILRDYETRYPGKIVVIDKPNEGVWIGRRDGIRIAQGEFIGFIDSDDYVEPDYCEKLYACATRNNADIAVCGFCRQDVNTGKIISTEMANVRTPFDISETPARLLELNGAPWNKIFRTELLKDLPDLPRPPKIFDDMMMHLLIYTRAHRVGFVPYSLVHYIIRGDSIMTNINEGQIDGTYAAMLDMRRIYIETGRNDLLEFLDAAAFLHMGISLMFRISCDPKANLKGALRRNREYLNENFPTWHTSSIISLRNARRYGGAFTKLYGAKLVYQARLMPAFLAAYRHMIASGKDIKW